MFKLCIVSIFFHLQEIHCNTLLRNMLFVLYLSHRILLLQPETENVHQQRVELKQSFLTESLKKDRLTHTYENQQPMFACGHGLGQQFSVLKPNETGHKRQENRCAMKFPVWAERPQPHILVINSPQRANIKLVSDLFYIPDTSNNPKLHRSTLDFST